MQVRRRCPDKPRTERHQKDLKVLARLWQSFEWRVMGPGNQASASYADQSSALSLKYLGLKDGAESWRDTIFPSSYLRNRALAIVRAQVKIAKLT